MTLSKRKRILLSVFELLLKEAFDIFQLVVNHLAVLCNRNYVRIDKAAVRLELEFGISFEHLFVQVRVDIYGIGLDESLSSLIVTFALDPLDFGEQLSEQSA